MPVDASIYNNIQQPNALQSAGQAIDVINGLQKNQMLQTQNQQQALLLKNAQDERQANLVLANHTNPDGTLAFTDVVSDPIFQSNAILQQKFNDRFLGNEKQVAVTGMENGKTVSKTMGTQEQAAQQYASDTANKTPHQLQSNAILENSDDPAHQDAATKARSVADSCNELVNNSLKTGNPITGEDITNTCLDHVNNGTMTAQHATGAIVQLVNPDGSPTDPRKVITAGAALSGAYNTIVNHTAAKQAQNAAILQYQANGGFNPSASIPVGTAETQTQNAQNYAKQATNDYETIKAQAAQDKNSLAFLNAAAIKAKTANTGTWANDFKNYGSVLEQLGLKGLSGGANDLASLQKDLENSKDIADPTDLARLNTAIKSGDIKTPQEALNELIRIRSAYTAEGAGKFDAMNHALGAEPNTNDVNKFTAAWQANRDPEAIQFARMQPEQQKAYLSLPTTNAKSLASKMARMESVDLGVKNPDGSPKMLDMTQYVGRQ